MMSNPNRPIHDFTRGGQAANNKKRADSRRYVGFRFELLVTGEKILSSGDMRSRVVKIQMCCHRNPIIQAEEVYVT